jgi:hypothetical protein
MASAKSTIIPYQPPRAEIIEPESFKTAKTTWLAAVTAGILLLLGASAIAMLAVKKANTGSQLLLELGLLAGPGGPKLWLISDLLRSSNNLLALLSIAMYMLGVLCVMWPERVGIMGLAGLGRLIASLLSVAALVFSILVVRANHDVQRLASVGFYDILPWLIFFDMAAMVLANMRIAGIAARGGFHRFAKFTGALMAAQVFAMLMLLVALNILQNGATLMWAAAGVYALGGAGVSIASLFLILILTWNLIFRPRPAKLAP